MTVGSLIKTLNEKAAAAGSPVRAEHYTFDHTWGQQAGVVLVGGSTEERERAAAFAEKYYRKHIEPRRTLSAQYAYSDRGEFAAYRVGTTKHLHKVSEIPSYESEAERTKLTVESFMVRGLSLVYWPCND